MVGLQPMLPTVAAALAYSRNTLGGLGESYAAQALESMGYRVDIAHERGRGDLRVIAPDGQIFYVEVKTAKRASDGRYHFTLIKQRDGVTHTDHRDCDYVIFLCVAKTGFITPYVVPTQAVADKRAAALPANLNKYNGWLSSYRQTIKKLRLQ